MRMVACQNRGYLAYIRERLNSSRSGFSKSSYSQSSYKLRKALVGSLLLVLLALSGCREQIIHHLSESEANRLITRLADVGIESEKVKQADGSWALAVDSASSVPALRAVSDARLLRNEDTAPLEKSSLMSSREDQRFRFERALARELEMTLNNIPAVLESRVHLNLPMVDPLFGQKLDSSPGSASVLLVATSDTVSRTDVASIVAGASGIPFKDISIMLSVTEPKPPEAASLLPRTSNAPLELSQSAAFPMAPKSEAPWYEQHREMVLQVAASLVIAGVGLALYLLRRKRKAEVFLYEAHQPV